MLLDLPPEPIPDGRFRTMPWSGLTYDGKRIYVLPQTHDPDGTCYFGPPVKTKITVETETRGSCTIYRPNFQSAAVP
jgi:hypothetical protein